MKNRPNLNQFLKESSFKKLIITGEKDPVLNFESSKEEAENTNSKLVVFPDGHMSHIENKTLLISTLKNFIKRC
jgi:pimeloyl-ACP methyl ester carboxylesterase